MPTDQITLQTHLWRMPEYRALDPKRRKLASAILLENQSLTAACNGIGGLNSSREKKNKLLAACLRAFNLSGGPSDATEMTSAADANLYDHVRRLEELPGAPPMEPEAGCTDAVIKLDPTDWLRVHLGVGALPVHPKALPADQASQYTEHIAALRPNTKPCGFCGRDVVDDLMCSDCRRERGGESPYKRAVCDGCAGPLPTRFVRGVHVMCAACHEGWQRTGKLQGAR